MNLEFQKLFDFSKIERKGIREILPINSRKFSTFSFRSFADPNTGITYGIPVNKDRDGNILFKQILITGPRQYNLENEEDAKEWAVVSMHPATLGSPLQKNKPLLKIFDANAEAEKDLQKEKEKLIAGAEAYKIDGEELVNFSRLMGISPEKNDPIVTKSLFVKAATDNPQKFFNLLKSPIRGVTEIFARAISVGLIKHTIDKGYLYDNKLPIGISDVHAVDYLSKDKSLLMNIDIESKSLDKALKHPGYQKKTVVEFKDNNEELIKQNAKLMEEIEALKSMLKDKSEGLDSEDDKKNNSKPQKLTK